MVDLKPALQGDNLTRIVITIGFIPLIIYLLEQFEIEKTLLFSYVGGEIVLFLRAAIILFLIASLASLALYFTEWKNQKKEIILKIHQKSYNYGIWSACIFFGLYIISYISEILLDFIKEKSFDDLRKIIFFGLICLGIYLSTKLTKEEKNEKRN